MSDKRSRDVEGDRGGPAEGKAAEPRDTGAGEGEPADVEDIPLGLPISEDEFRRLKEEARRPSEGEAPPEADHDPEEEA